MADITVLYQQTLKSASATVSSVSLEPLRAGVEYAIGTGINYAAAGAETLFQPVSPALTYLLKQALCQGNLSNNDLFNNPELNCAVALGAASMVCGGVAPGVLPTDILTCTSPKAPVVNVTNNGSDCSIDFECDCPSDDENSPIDTNGFNPEELADSVADCQLRAAKDHLKKVTESLDYFNISDAAVRSTAGNIFASVTLQTLFEQINYTIENSESVSDINNTLNQVAFNTSYFISPAARIVQLLNNKNPGSGDAFLNAWSQLSDLYNAALFDIQSTCALTANVTAADIATFLSGLSPKKKKTCDPTFVLNEDTCECECPPDHYPCVYNAGIIGVINPTYTRCLPCPSPKEFNSDTCECECPSNKVEKNGNCLDPCPEGTILREVPCDGEHTQVVLNDDGEILSTTCYDCFCRKNLGATGTVLLPFLPDNLVHVPALTCSGEGQVRLTRADCECDCDRAAGYGRVYPPNQRWGNDYITPEPRCRLPCEPNRVYVWSLDDCVCPNRILTSDISAGAIRIGDFIRLKTPIEMCGEADGSFGKVWRDDFCECLCPSGVSIYDPESDICACPSGMVPDQESKSCICPSGTELVVRNIGSLEYSFCEPVCEEGQVRRTDGVSSQCEDICPSGTIYIDGLCLPIDGSGSGDDYVWPSGIEDVPDWPIDNGSGSGSDITYLYSTNNCLQALTCCNGMLYPNSCCGDDGSTDLGLCEPEQNICLQRITCCDGTLYPNSCCGSDGSSPIGPCDTEDDPDNGRICTQAVTCCDCVLYPNGCCGSDGSSSMGPC